MIQSTMWYSDSYSFQMAIMLPQDPFQRHIENSSKHLRLSFCKNSRRQNIVHSFLERHHQMFDRFLNTPLHLNTFSRSKVAFIDVQTTRLRRAGKLSWQFTSLFSSCFNCQFFFCLREVMYFFVEMYLCKKSFAQTSFFLAFHRD